jgi:hypothetical protein
MWIDEKKIRYEDFHTDGYGEDELLTAEEQAEWEQSLKG